MSIKIDSLIQEGKDIHKELTYVRPSAGEWRMYDEYALKNLTRFYSRGAMYFRFIKTNYPKENIAKIFPDAAVFEHKNNHYCSHPLDKMIRILESCKTLSITFSQKENPMMTLNDEILNIEKSYSISEFLQIQDTIQRNGLQHFIQGK